MGLAYVVVGLWDRVPLDKYRFAQKSFVYESLSLRTEKSSEISYANFVHDNHS